MPGDHASSDGPQPDATPAPPPAWAEVDRRLRRPPSTWLSRSTERRVDQVARASVLGRAAPAQSIDACAPSAVRGDRGRPRPRSRAGRSAVRCTIASRESGAEALGHGDVRHRRRARRARCSAAGGQVSTRRRRSGRARQAASARWCQRAGTAATRYRPGSTPDPPARVVSDWSIWRAREPGGERLAAR